jgi:sulfide dehydrogenase cytochrome subunit
MIVSVLIGTWSHHASAAALPDRVRAPGTTGRDIAASCMSCHRISDADNAPIPALGSDAAVIARRMREIRAGTRPATVMQQLAKGYTDAEIDAAAGYLATVTPDGRSTSGPRR